MLYKTRGAMVKYEEKLMYEKQVFDTFFINIAKYTININNNI